MIDARTIRRYVGDPAAFRADLTIPASGGAARLGDVIAPFQERDFRALDAALIALRDGRKPELSRFWLERTKGASKDSDLAVELVWLLLACPRPLTIQIGAADSDQAAEIRKAIKDLVRLNEWLGDTVLDVQAKAIVNVRTDGRADILTSDAASSHGARPDVVIVNELSHIGDRDFVETLLDNATKTGALVIVATNAGFLDSWQHEWREDARTSPRWHFSAVTEPAPWIDPAELAEAEKRNPPSRFARLWRGQWVPAVGDAVAVANVLRAIDPDAREVTAPRPDLVFVAGLDLALKRDNAALCVLGVSVPWVERLPLPVKPKHTPPSVLAMRDLGLIEEPDPEPTHREVWHESDGRIRLATVRVWRAAPGGQIDLQAIEDAVGELHDRLGLSLVLADQWQAGQMCQRLQRAGVPVELTHITGSFHSVMASEVVTGFNDCRFVIYQDPDLTADLKRMQLIERPNGSRLHWTRGSNTDGHGDAGTAFGLATVAASRVNGAITPRGEIKGELLAYP